MFIMFQDPVAGSNLTLLRRGNKKPDRREDLFAHYSFDIVQQVHYKWKPQQPNPIFPLESCQMALLSVIVPTRDWGSFVVLVQEAAWPAKIAPF